MSRQHAEIPKLTDSELKEIMERIRAETTYDFEFYKETTLRRRLRRRMGLRSIASAEEYLEYMRSNPEEAQILVQDFLIGVTSFFRDPEGWEAVREDVLTELVRDYNSEEPIRIWVAACASGQEAYTLAMLLLEQMEKQGRKIPFKVFATDLHDAAVQKARKGCYPSDIAEQIPPELLAKYFNKTEEGYRVDARLRERIVFSRQDLLGDPPFSHLDIISCRNFMIYLEQSVQERVVKLFHYALRQGGYLLLGQSETVGQKNLDCYEQVSETFRIYRKQGSSGISQARPLAQRSPNSVAKNKSRSIRTTMRADGKEGLVQLMQHALLDAYAPPGVMINTQRSIICFFGDTAPYLTQPSGVPTADLYVRLREGLAGPVYALLDRAGKEPVGQKRTQAQVKRGDAYVTVTIAMTTVEHSATGECFQLLTFSDEEPVPAIINYDRISPDVQTLVRQLEKELSIARSELQNRIAENESSCQEVKASNEEIMSMNEELQSSNEELETTMEELQTMNEELIAANREREAKIEELRSLNNDLNNLIGTTDMAIIFLDRQLNIRRFTDAARRVLHVIGTDIGRPLNDITLRVQDDLLIKDIHSVFRSQKPTEREVRGEDAKWYRRRVMPYWCDDETMSGAVLVYDDISDLKAYQHTLEQNEERLRSALDAVSDGTWVWNVSDGSTEVNARSVEMMGFDPGRPYPGTEEIFSRIVAEDLPSVRRAIQDHAEGKTPVYFKEFRVRHPNGEVRWVLGRGRVIEYDSAGNPRRMIGTNTDITDRKQHEEELREYEQLLEATGRMAKVGGWEVDPETLEVTWTEAVKDLFEYEGEGMPGLQEVISQYDEHDRAVVQRCVETALETGQDFEYVARLTTFRGNRRWAHVIGHARMEAGRCVQLRGTVQDITEEKRAQQRLAGVENRMAVATDSAEIGVWEYDVDSGTLNWDAWMRRLYGVADDVTLSYEVWTNLLHPEDRDAVLQDVEDALEGKKQYDTAFRIVRADTGDCRYIKAYGKVVADEDGRVVRMIGVNYDVTERVEAQGRIQQQASVLNQIMDVVTVTDLNGVITYVNKAVCEMLGRSEEELIGQRVTAFGENTDSGASQEDIVQHTLEHGVWRGEVINYGADGREVILDCRTQIVRDVNGNPVAMCGISTDITERRRTERELLKMEKLQSIGLLAGGIAHDFNNILMGLFGNIEQARNQLERSHPACAFLAEAGKSMERATSLTNRLLTFAKGGNPVMDDVNLEELVRDIVSFDLSGSAIRPVFDIEEGLWLASVDKVQIQQVVSNLIINAREAMTTAGCLHISLHNRSLREEDGGLDRGNYVELVVRDEGEGISDDVCEHIFDPYFTTKQTGSGLGLATVYSIVTKHGGSITFDTSPSQGTAFTVLLPAVDHAVNEADASDVAADSTSLKDARVLVMDDEDMICRLIKGMLGRVTKEVVAAHDGEEAVRLYREALDAGRPYDVVIMDLTIKGGLGGREAVQKLLQLDSDARVVVSSGYAEDSAMSDYRRFGFKGVVTKPYNRMRLIKVLTEAVEK